jgi:hypothetical protein
MNNHASKTFAIAISSFLLAGCFGPSEPAGADMKIAIKQSFVDSMKPFGGNANFTINEFQEAQLQTFRGKGGICL